VATPRSARPRRAHRGRDQQAVCPRREHPPLCDPRKGTRPRRRRTDRHTKSSTRHDREEVWARTRHHLPGGGLMQYFMQLLLSGLAIGAIYGLIAMGFAVIYKSTGLVNFAQGEMTMITAYIAWTISTTVSGNVFVVTLGAILAAVVLGLVIERVVMRPMLGGPGFATVMGTLGV